MDKLATLQQQLQEAEDKKVALQDQVRICSVTSRTVGKCVSLVRQGQNKRNYS